MPSYIRRQGNCAAVSDSPGKRLTLFRASSGLSQRAFAQQLGVSGGLIGQLEADLSDPSRAFLQKISDRYNVSADWLLNGHGDMLHAPQRGLTRQRANRIEPRDPSLPLQGDFRFNGEEFAMIPRMDLSVSAGNGLIAVEGGASEALAFSRSWLMRNGISADLAVLVRVKGESMAPSIPDGALVLVHLPELNVEKEGIYAFNRDGASFVKRLVPSDPGRNGRPTSIAILSDNPTFPPELLSGEALNDIRVVGRVRCVLTTL